MNGPKPSKLLGSVDAETADSVLPQKLFSANTIWKRGKKNISVVLKENILKVFLRDENLYIFAIQ